MYLSTGTLRYSPKLVANRSEKWWMIIDADPEIGRLYRNLYKNYFYSCKFLQRPSWKEHITIIRDEEPPIAKQALWEKYQGKQIEFRYFPQLRTNGLYFWLDVECEELFQLRTELGLSRDPEVPFHLTIGHTGESASQSF